MNISAVFENWTVKEAGFALAIVVHFAGLVWGVATMNSSLDAVASGLEKQGAAIVRLQENQNDLQVRLAVEEALRNAGVGSGVDTRGPAR